MTLSRLERRAVVAISEAVAPARPPALPAPDPVALVASVEEGLAAMPRYKQLLVRAALLVLCFSPLAQGRARLLPALDAADRLRIIETWYHSRLFLRRAVGMAVVATVLMSHFSDDTVMAALGWRTGPIDVTPLDPETLQPLPARPASR
jgi:hypothetical protein